MTGYPGIAAYASDFNRARDTALQSGAQDYKNGVNAGIADRVIRCTPSARRFKDGGGTLKMAVAS